jgi:invasion protein IalB
MCDFAHSARHLTATLAGLALLCLGAAAPAAAQTQQAPAAGITAANGETWSHVCPEGQGFCQIVQNIVTTEQAQRLLTIVVRPQAAGETDYVMIAALPHGIFLPAGVQFQVDEGEAQTVAIQTADANGSYAGVPATADLIAAMKAGQTLKVTFAAQNRQGVTVPVTLTGFTNAFNKLES